MNKQLIEKWITALRSGKYQQCRYQLRDEDTYCALGVACDIAGIDWAEYLTNDFSDTVPEDIAKEYGFNEENEELSGLCPIYCLDLSIASTIAGLNDYNQWNFNQIADFIETHLLSLAS